MPALAEAVKRGSFFLFTPRGAPTMATIPTPGRAPDPAFVVSVLPFGITEDEFAVFAKGHGCTAFRRPPEDRQALQLLTVTYACNEPGTFGQYVFNYKVHIATARSHGPGRLAVSKAALRAQLQRLLANLA